MCKAEHLGWSSEGGQAHGQSSGCVTMYPASSCRCCWSHRLLFDVKCSKIPSHSWYPTARELVWAWDWRKGRLSAIRASVSALLAPHGRCLLDCTPCLSSPLCVSEAQQLGHDGVLVHLQFSLSVSPCHWRAEVTFISRVQLNGKSATHLEIFSLYWLTW